MNNFSDLSFFSVSISLSSIFIGKSIRPFDVSLPPKDNWNRRLTYEGKGKFHLSPSNESVRMREWKDSNLREEKVLMRKEKKKKGGEKRRHQQFPFPSFSSRIDNISRLSSPHLHSSSFTHPPLPSHSFLFFSHISSDPFTHSVKSCFAPCSPGNRKKNKFYELLLYLLMFRKKNFPFHENVTHLIPLFFPSTDLYQKTGREKSSSRKRWVRNISVVITTFFILMFAVIILRERRNSKQQIQVTMMTKMVFKMVIRSICSNNSRTKFFGIWSVVTRFFVKGGREICIFLLNKVIQAIVRAAIRKWARIWDTLEWKDDAWRRVSIWGKNISRTGSLLHFKYMRIWGYEDRNEFERRKMLK